MGCSFAICNKHICSIVLVVTVISNHVLSAAADSSASPLRTEYLPQGWNEAEREEFYYTPQGSQLIPYEWFLVLEQKNGTKLFRENSNLERFRFVVRPASAQNRDGLPVGLVEDKDLDDSQVLAKRAYLSRRAEASPPTPGKTWLGMTCAACHTARIEHGGAAIQIDGAPTLLDLQAFLAELVDSLEATHRDPQKMERFAAALKAENKDSLKKQVADHAQILKQLVERNATKNRYGFGRLDAFGAILNAVCEGALDIQCNRIEPNAPVSYPALWNAPQMDWVQWNSSADRALARNVGEVLGVFGLFTLNAGQGKQQFDSTVRLHELMKLEKQISRLKSPAWPNRFGELSKQKVADGKKLFSENCAKCHQVRDDQGNFVMTGPSDDQRIKTSAFPLSVMRTDSQMILNLGATASPGVLKDLLPPELINAPRISRATLLALTVRGVIESRMKAEREALPRPAPEKPPLNGAGYIARPLEGIWATAPFLHNGSVPNLYELLLPSSRRSKSFYVGSRKFDPERVGYTTEKSPGAFELKVADENGPIVGNSNAGHEGHGTSEQLGFTERFVDGKWREFTDPERYALIEYMKSLGPVQSEQLAEAPPAAVASTAPAIEQVPPGEAAQIENIVSLTIQQLKNRYTSQGKTPLRGVHAKDHGCVKATFEVSSNLDEKYRVGIFAEPGKRYDASIRFSNAATLVLPDNVPTSNTFGSRGMAIKLTGVKGTPIAASNGPAIQDFLMVNHPVFAFSNVEDYEVLSTVLADPANKESPLKFFAIQTAKAGAAAARAQRTGGIIKRIQAATVAEGAFQPQPGSPVDCRYFSGAPFKFGDGYVMKFSAVPVDPPAESKPDVAEPHYLRKALTERLAPRDGAKPVQFRFQVQLRTPASLKVAEDIEDACVAWCEADYPFVTVATITIPPQNFDSPEQLTACEALVFSPWQCVQEHRPLGGINRMRRAVYEASSRFRGPANHP